MRPCGIAQGSVSSHLWWNIMEDNVRKRIYIYIYMFYTYVYILFYIYSFMYMNIYSFIYVYIFFYIYVCILLYKWLGHFAVQQRLTQHCKSTIIKIKFKINKKVYIRKPKKVFNLNDVPASQLFHGLCLWSFIKKFNTISQVI